MALRLETAFVLPISIAVGLEYIDRAHVGAEEHVVVTSRSDEPKTSSQAPSLAPSFCCSSQTLPFRSCLPRQPPWYRTAPARQTGAPVVIWGRPAQSATGPRTSYASPGVSSMVQEGRPESAPSLGVMRPSGRGFPRRGQPGSDRDVATRIRRALPREAPEARRRSVGGAPARKPSRRKPEATAARDPGESSHRSAHGALRASDSSAAEGGRGGCRDSRC